MDYPSQSVLRLPDSFLERSAAGSQRRDPFSYHGKGVVMVEAPGAAPESCACLANPIYANL